MKIALYQPEIPPNTGNIIRLCANTNCELHLIGPMTFSIDEKSCRRAGLDYKSLTHVFYHQSWDHFVSHTPVRHIVALTTKGQTLYHKYSYDPDDILLFGPETRGLPDSIIQSADTTAVRIPMAAGNRSLNLANAAAIVTYEALRQHDFKTHKSLLI